MGIFSNRGKKKELILVFNIGSSFVGGALFQKGESGIPRIVFSTREPILVENKIDIDRFLVCTVEALELVANKIFKAGVGAPSKIFCVLSSPWLVSQTRTIIFKKNTPFVFSTKLADDLIQKEIKLFEEENKTKYGDTGPDIRVIELKSMKTMLNGYETSKPLNQKAQELEMTIFLSISGEQVLKKIEDTIRKHFHSNLIKFSSSTMATFTVIRNLFPEQENFLLVYIGGEVTDISMIKKNTLRESISFPLGCNFLSRGVASGLGVTLGEANSLISLYKDGHAEEYVTRNLVSIMNDLKAKWLEKFQESLANLSNDISIPATIFIDMGRDLAEFFSETIRTEQFSQYTLTESKFKITLLDTKLLHGMAIFEDTTIREPFLIIDAVYINSFLAKI